MAVIHYDHVAAVLRSSKNLDDPTRADLHDLATASASPEELSGHLDQLDDLDPEVKQRLIQAKGMPTRVRELISEPQGRWRWSDDTATDPVKLHMDKIISAIDTMSAIDREKLDLAESHKNIFQAYIAASKDSK